MSQNLHPIVADALRGVIPPPEDARVASYRALLRRHDWAHEFADDFRAYSRGRAEREHLLAEQKAVDPDFRIWNAHCHPWCRDGRAYPAYPFTN